MPAIRTPWGAGLWGAYDPGAAETWQGTPFEIAEQGGRGRRVELRGTALPYQPIELPMERRARTWRYDGQPTATQHVLGYGLGATTVRGQWHGAELAHDDLALLYEGGRAEAIKSTEDLRDLLYAMIRDGQDVTVTWAGLVRRTADWGFTPRHMTREHMEWELRFTWAGDSTSKKVELPATDPLQTVADGWFDLVGDWLDRAKYPAHLGLDTLDWVHMQAGRIEALVVELRDIVGLYLEGVESALGLATRAVGIFESIKGAGRAIRDRSVALTAPAAAVGLTDASPAEGAVQARIQEWLATTKRQSTTVVAQAQRRQSLCLDVSDPRLEGIVVTQGPTDLRQVASRVGWPPEQWTVIAEYNDIVGSQVAAGTTILIPARATGG